MIKYITSLRTQKYRIKNRDVHFTSFLRAHVYRLYSALRRKLLRYIQGVTNKVDAKATEEL